jgi:serralysin
MGAGMGIVGLASDVVIENAIGGSGDDTLRGNTANNTFTGNAGFDSFVFDTLTGSDTITDFTALFDTLKFSAATFSAAGIANITAGSAINASDLLIGTSITSASSTGENFLYDSDSSVLYYDADGVAGGAVEIVDLGTNNTIDETDIVMIA